MTKTRLIFSGLCCLLCLVPLKGQDKSKPVSQGTLYKRALSTGVEAMAQSWGDIDDTCCISSLRSTRIRTDYRHLIVEKDDVSDGLPTRFGDHEIEYLDVKGLSDRYRRLRKQFSILRIHPMREIEGNLRVVIGVYWFEIKRQRVSYAFSDWSEVSFRYDCEKREWVIADVKLGGI